MVQYKLPKASAFSLNAVDVQDIAVAVDDNVIFELTNVLTPLKISAAFIPEPDEYPNL